MRAANVKVRVRRLAPLDAPSEPPVDFVYVRVHGLGVVDRTTV